MKVKMETEIKCPFCGSADTDLDDLHDFNFEASTALAIWLAHCKTCGKTFFRHDEYEISGGESFKPRE